MQTAWRSGQAREAGHFAEYRTARPPYHLHAVSIAPALARVAVLREWNSQCDPGRGTRPPGPAPRRRLRHVKAGPFGTWDRHDPEATDIAMLKIRHRDALLLMDAYYPVPGR